MKKFNLIAIALMISLASSVFADNVNSLVQMDLKKSSNDSVDVTLFTTNSYNDNVLVRKKSDNKYVILIPKVQSSGFSASNLSGVKELVSNVDVKTVNDTNGGYTKVTLITTKPLDIKTRAQKSAPVTEEQKEYKTLMAQANTIKNSVGEQIIRPKTEVTVNKAPAAPKQTAKSKNEVKSKAQNAPKIELTEINPEKIQRQIRREHLTEMINEAKQEKKLAQALPPLPEQVAPKTELQDLENIAPVEYTAKSSIISKLINKAKKTAKPIGKVLLGLFALMFISKIVRGIAGRAVEYSEVAFKEPTIPQTNVDIDENLSWQEKYKLYLDKDAKPVARANNQGNYTFIKNPAETIERKRIELEKLVTEESLADSIEPEIVEVHSEDDVINKAIKFKAFDNHSVSLSKSDRMKSRFKKYEVEIPLQEQKTVTLGDSMLHTNPRSLKGANLNVADVDKKRIKFKHQDYVMSSIDEYFSILDKEEKTQTNPIVKPAFHKGLIVKSGFNIDENKGFYLVNKNGQNALIGKIKDEVFVLKKFDSNISNPIQVRHDNANVYMVKAGKFKSLVEVNPDKMGVLIEL